jgi:hypothetical protein
MTIPTFSLPVFPFHFLSQKGDRSPVGWITPPHSRRELTPTDPDRHSCTFDSADVLQDPGNALLDRFGSLYRGFLSEVPKFLVLRGCDAEVLMRLRG